MDLILERIEADVVFVGTNKQKDTVHVACYWECDIPPKELLHAAARMGLAWNEADGGGEVTVQIFDYRT